MADSENMENKIKLATPLKDHFIDKTILESRSDYFKSILNFHHNKDSTFYNTVKFDYITENVKSNSIEAFIDYLKTNSIDMGCLYDEHGLLDVLNMLVLADKYLCMDLLNLIFGFLNQIINITNYEQIFEYSSMVHAGLTRLTLLYKCKKYAYFFGFFGSEIDEQIISYTDNNNKHTDHVHKITYDDSDDDDDSCKNKLYEKTDININIPSLDELGLKRRDDYYNYYRIVSFNSRVEWDKTLDLNEGDLIEFENHDCITYVQLPNGHVGSFVFFTYDKNDKRMNGAFFFIWNPILYRDPLKCYAFGLEHFSYDYTKSVKLLNLSNGNFLISYNYTRKYDGVVNCLEFWNTRCLVKTNYLNLNVNSRTRTLIEMPSGDILTVCLDKCTFHISIWDIETQEQKFYTRNNLTTKYDAYVGADAFITHTKQLFHIISNHVFIYDEELVLVKEFFLNDKFKNNRNSDIYDEMVVICPNEDIIHIYVKEQNITLIYDNKKFELIHECCGPDGIPMVTANGKTYLSELVDVDDENYEISVFDYSLNEQIRLDFDDYGFFWIEEFFSCEYKNFMFDFGKNTCLLIFKPQYDRKRKEYEAIRRMFCDCVFFKFFI